MIVPSPTALYEGKSPTFRYVLYRVISHSCPNPFLYFVAPPTIIPTSVTNENGLSFPSLGSVGGLRILWINPFSLAVRLTRSSSSNTLTVPSHPLPPPKHSPFRSCHLSTPLHQLPVPFLFSATRPYAFRPCPDPQPVSLGVPVLIARTLFWSDSKETQPTQPATSPPPVKYAGLYTPNTTTQHALFANYTPKTNNPKQTDLKF